MTLVDSQPNSQEIKIAATAIIEDGVEIGPGTSIGEYSIIRSGTRIGAGNIIGPHVIIGEAPQDTSYRSETSYVEIGDYNIIREFSSIHKATGEGEVTKLGNNNFLMVNSHLGHNSVVGNNTTMANNACLGGHVSVEDQVTIGGSSVVHQHCRLGKHMMLAGQSASNHDLLPFMVYVGTPACSVSTNRVGLKRNGISQKALSELMRAYKIIYGAERLSHDNMMSKLENELEQLDEGKYLINFIKESNRGIARGVYRK